MKALDIASELCKTFEGFRPKPYLCPANVPTIGHGTTYYPSGVKVSLSDHPITREQAEEYLEHELSQCLTKAIKYSPCLALYENRLASITDFIYNLGAGRYQQSTLRRKVNQENWTEAKTQILKWDKANGKVLKGLKLRREAEARLL